MDVAVPTIPKTWCKNLEGISGGEEEWYAEARTSRAGWRTTYRLENNIQAGHEKVQGVQTGEALVVVKDVVSEVCSRSFRRLADKKR